MAIPFRSYLQPLLLMSAIPFGLVGAIWGHLLMGMDLSAPSVVGMVALTGIVVNDSLILVDRVHHNQAAGLSADQAVREARVRRFRPILLTALTTFVGLIPLLLEKSTQTRFLTPVAISLGFGELFSTAISLVLVPAGYLLFEDLKALCVKRGLG
jgi:multidrug efflux pump subunit AcrB